MSNKAVFVKAKLWIGIRCRCIGPADEASVVVQNPHLGDVYSVWDVTLRPAKSPQVDQSISGIVLLVRQCDWLLLCNRENCDGESSKHGYRHDQVPLHCVLPNASDCPHHHCLLLRKSAFKAIMQRLFFHEVGLTRAKPGIIRQWGKRSGISALNQCLIPMT
jgi:hypothetical protein